MNKKEQSRKNEDGAKTNEYETNNVIKWGWSKNPINMKQAILQNSEEVKKSQ